MKWTITMKLINCWYFTSSWNRKNQNIFLDLRSSLIITYRKMWSFGVCSASANTISILNRQKKNNLIKELFFFLILRVQFLFYIPLCLIKTFIDVYLMHYYVKLNARISRQWTELPSFISTTLSNTINVIFWYGIRKYLVVK